MEKTELIGLISVVHRKTQIYLNQELKKYGLNSAEFVYLIHIQDNEPSELKSLGARLRMDDAQTTRVIKSLEGKGLATKLRNPKDRRAYDVSLTDHGRDLKPKIIKDLNSWVDLITKGVEPNEMNQFISILRKTAKKAVELTEGK